MTQLQDSPPPLSVLAPPGSRLEELLASYEAAKAAAETATSRFKAITDGIKSELSGTYPGTAEMILSGAPGLPSLKLAWRLTWRLNSKQLKEDNPLLYVQYAEQSGTWELRQRG